MAVSSAAPSAAVACQEQLLPSDRVPDGPSWRALILGVYVPSSLCFFAYGLGLLGLPLMCGHWGIPVATIAYLKTVAEMAETAFSLPASNALVRYGAHGCLLLGSAGFTLASFLLLEAPGFPSLACAYFLQSGAVKFFNRGRGAVLKDVPKAFRGRTSGYLVFCRCSCMSAAPLALALSPSALVAPQRIFAVHVFLGFTMIAVLLVSTFAQIGAPHSLRDSGQDRPRPVIVGGSDAKVCMPSYRDVLRSEVCRAALCRTAGLCSCISVLVGSSNILLPVVPLAFGIPVTTVSLVMSSCYVVAWVFSTCGGAAADKFGRRATLVLAITLLALGLAALGCLPLVGSGHEVLLLALVAVLLGLGDALASPLRFALKSDNADCVGRWASETGQDRETAIARSFGMLDILIDLVGCAYPIVLGLCATYYSASFASLSIAMVGLLGTFWSMFLPASFD